MGEKAKKTSKSPSSKRDNSIAHLKNSEFSRSITPSVGQSLFLQSTFGNQAVQRLFNSNHIQAKLKINQPSDKYEQEAENITKQLMRMPKPVLSRTTEKDEENSKQTRQQCNSFEVNPFYKDNLTEGSYKQSKTDGFKPQIKLNPQTYSKVIQGGGQPLPKYTRTYFEDRMNVDLSQVRVHSRSQASELAENINAKAFTLGHHVIFGKGRYAPNGIEGRRLLSHELTHVIQQNRTDSIPPSCRMGIHNENVGSYNPSISSGQVSNSIQRSPETKEEKKVLSPEELFELIVTQRAFSFSKGGELVKDPKGIGRKVGPAAGGKLAGHSVFAAIQITDKSGNLIDLGYGEHLFYKDEHAEIRALRALENMTLPYVNVSGGMIIVVVDQKPCPNCAKALKNFAKRYSLGLKVYLPSRPSLVDPSIEVKPRAAAMGSQRIDIEKTMLKEIPELSIQPPSGEIVKITIPTESDIGFSLFKNLQDLNSNILIPKILPTYASLHDPSTLKEIIQKHNSIALVGGNLYKITLQHDRILYEQIEPSIVSFKIAKSGMTSTPTTGLVLPISKKAQDKSLQLSRTQTLNIPPPSGQYLTEKPPIINLRPRGAIQIGQTIYPPSLAKARVGDLVVVGGVAEWFVVDVRTFQPVAFIPYGGKWYRVTTPNKEGLVIDPVTRTLRYPTVIKLERGEKVYLTPIAKDVTPMPKTGFQRLRHGPIAGVAAVGGIFAVINELLGPIGSALDMDRQNIKKAQEEINFWNRLGADPIMGIWDTYNKKLLSPKTPPKTGFFKSYHPCVIDINIDKLRNNLLKHKYDMDYQSFIGFLDLGQILGTITKDKGNYWQEGGKFYAYVNKCDWSNVKKYDVTDVIEEIRKETILKSDERMRQELKKLPPSELGNIYQLKSGSNTKLFRAANGQPILSAHRFLGSNPWVRTTGKREGGGIWSWGWHGHYQPRVLVTPANTDALKAALNCAYKIDEEIDDVLKEVEKGGRPIESKSYKGTGIFKRLEAFVAGPDTATPPRFGTTRYYRHPQLPNTCTAAIGELKQFWVDADELEPVSKEKLKK